MNKLFDCITASINEDVYRGGKYVLIGKIARLEDEYASAFTSYGSFTMRITNSKTKQMTRISCYSTLSKNLNCYYISNPELTIKIKITTDFFLIYVLPIGADGAFYTLNIEEGILYGMFVPVNDEIPSYYPSNDDSYVSIEFNQGCRNVDLNFLYKATSDNIALLNYFNSVTTCRNYSAYVYVSQTVADNNSSLLPNSNAGIWKVTTDIAISIGKGIQTWEFMYNGQYKKYIRLLDGTTWNSFIEIFSQ